MSDNLGPQHPYGGSDQPGGQPGGGQWQGGSSYDGSSERGSSQAGPFGWQPTPTGYAGQPPYGAPLGFGQQQRYGQQQKYGQPQGYGQPYGGQGQGGGYPPVGYGQQGFDHQIHGQPGPPPGPARRSRSAVILTAIAVVVALLAAGSFLYFGNREAKSAGGQASPQDAANAMLLSLTKKDPIGVVDQLDPAEASLFSDFTGDILTELKRLQIVDASASASDLTGSTMTASGLTYDNVPDRINDHVSVVKLIGGTVTITSDPSKLPITDKIKKAAGDKLTAMEPSSRTIDIAAEVRKMGHPIRISTVQRDGRWYPSLLYTAADYWAQSKGVGDPTAADFIPATGGSSPQDTMNKLLEAGTSADTKALIALLPPDEMAVLHDYGLLLTRNSRSDATAAGKVHFSHATWDVTDVTGGRKVSVRTLTVTVAGKDHALVRNPAAGSLTVTVPGQAPVTLDDSTLDGYLSKMGGLSLLAPQLVKIVKSEFKQVIGLGVVMTQTGGRWYASPLRSYTGTLVALLKGLDAGDVVFLISLAKK